MGAVLRGRHEGTGAIHAVKVIGSAASERSLSRFRREAEVLARIDAHPNVVKVHAFGVEGGTPWCAMELVEGVTLAEQLRHGPIEPSRAASLVTDVARAIAFVHAHAVVHRDLEPENVIVEAGSDRPRVLDFGLAPPPRRPWHRSLDRSGATTRDVIEAARTIAAALGADRCCNGEAAGSVEELVQLVRRLVDLEVGPLRRPQPDPPSEDALDRMRVEHELMHGRGAEALRVLDAAIAREKGRLAGIVVRGQIGAKRWERLAGIHDARAELRASLGASAGEVEEDRRAAADARDFADTVRDAPDPFFVPPTEERDGR